MARGINKVILIGNLGGDPEVRYTPSGSAVATVNIATSDGWKDKQTGEMQERTEWHRIVMWRFLRGALNPQKANAVVERHFDEPALLKFHIQNAFYFLHPASVACGSGL